MCTVHTPDLICESDLCSVGVRATMLLSRFDRQADGVRTGSFRKG